MKFIIFAVVLCLTAHQIFAANPKVKVSTWGRITNRVLDTKRIIESSIPWMVKTKTLKFPEVRQIIAQNWYWLFGIDKNYLSTLTETIGLSNRWHSTLGLQVTSSFIEIFERWCRALQRNSPNWFATRPWNQFNHHFLHSIISWFVEIWKNSMSFVTIPKKSKLNC